MKKVLFVLFTLIAGTMTLVSCHSESVSYVKENTGTVNLASMKVNLDIETEKARVNSRAEVSVDNYKVSIYSEKNETMGEWVYSEMPDVFTLPTGKYKIVAQTPHTVMSQFEVPFCYGESAAFEIKKDEVVDAGEVNCTLKSVKVTIKYSESLYALLGEDAKVTVELGQTALDFLKDEQRSGFFYSEAEKNTFHVVFSATLEGSPVISNKLYADVKNGSELIITFDMKESQGDPSTGGTVTPGGIEIIENCEIIELSFNVLPNDDVIEDFGKPSITGEGFDISQPVTDMTKPVVVLLKAPEGMAHVNVNITSTNTEFVGAVNQIFTTLPFDLAYPNDALAEQLKSLGFPIKEQIIGQQGVVKFDITSFLTPLSSFAGKHTFSIEVIDAFGDKANADLIIEI